MSSNEAIAASLTRIYHLMRDIGYLIHQHLFIAPHDEEFIDVDLWRAAGMNDTAIEFLLCIPWATTGWGDFIPDSEMIDFTDAHCITQTRNFTPSSPDTDAETPEINGAWVSLTMRGTNGYALVVDTSRGTIRKWNGVGDVCLVEEKDACEVLDAIHQRYLDLEEIPWTFHILKSAGLPNGIHGPNVRVTSMYDAVKRAARNTGWPDGSVFSIDPFRQEVARLMPSPPGRSVASSEDRLEEVGALESIAEGEEEEEGEGEGEGEEEDEEEGVYL